MLPLSIPLMGIVLSTFFTLSMSYPRLRSRAQPPFQLKRVPPSPATGPMTVQVSSNSFAFSSPKLSAVNSTSFEWYWFDVVSSDLSASLVVIFFTASPLAFPLFGPIPSDVSLAVTAKLPNGSVFFSEVPASEGYVASGGVFGQGAVGDWVDASAKFASTRDGDAWIVNVDTTTLDPVSGIKANIVLKGRAPPHYPCSPSLSPGQRLKIVPHLGWANAVPDSVAEVTIALVDGAEYYLGNGAIGYHDHNWGDIPFPETIRSWYWGHAQRGEWSVVFFDGVAANGQKFADAYVARAGKVILIDCDPQSVNILETGTIEGGLPILEVRINLPRGEILAVELKAESVNAFVEGVYERFLTGVSGGVVGRRNVTGVGMFEHFLEQQA
jgi:hypothetical protein